jgi:glycosyltransferase A (GT-A) superfamily protein (DUF2064 family)
MAGARIWRTAIVVVAKAPLAGIAKTRLGVEIGYAEAARLYEAFLLDSLQTIDTGLVAPPSVIDVVSRGISCPDESHASALTAIVHPGWSIVPQRRNGLMGALADSFEDGFAAGADVVVVIDADSPGLPFSHVEECVRLVDLHQAVLGPTLDGGYYLIAVHRDLGQRAAELVLGRAYDGQTICDETIRHAERLGLTATKGPVGFDVDTVEDLRRLIRELPPGGLERTRLALAELGPILAAPRPGR